jgi:hypothetical protein
VWGQNESMCGRYVMSKATGNLLSHFAAKEIEGSPPPPSCSQSSAICAKRPGRPGPINP